MERLIECVRIARKSRLIAATVTMAFAAITNVTAQEITSTLQGTISQPNGQPAVGVEVVITDTRDGSRSSAMTDDRGVASLRSIKPGGPYVVRISTGDFQDVLITDLYTGISGTTTFDATLAEIDAAIDEITVTAAALSMVDVAAGPSSTFSLEDIENMPSTQRQIRDIIRVDPRVSISASGDPTRGSGGQISCLGGNSRTNSFTIDGVRNGDAFGLNVGGNLARFTFPIPFDSVGAAAVEFAPVSVEYGQFSGCNVNVTTKSGGNEFRGGGFYLFNDDSLTGDEISGVTFDQGDFERTDWGLEFSGPIIRDKLFFYASYEETDTAAINERGTVDGGFPISDTIYTTAEVNRIKSILESPAYGRFVGEIVSNLPSVSERFFTRFDWNVNDDHRVEAAFATLEESTSVNDDMDGTGRGDFTFSENFFQRGSESETYSVRVFSNWTDRLSTELRYSHQKVDDLQDPLGGGEAQDSPIPRIVIGPPGFKLEFFGQEFANGPGVFRSANQLNTETDQFKLKMDFEFGDHLLTTGYERESTDVFNLFIINATGTVFFDGIDELEAGTAAQIRQGVSFTRNPSDAAAQFTRDINALYVQDQWQVSDALQLIFGVRYDWYTSNDTPLPNPNYTARYGLTNEVAFDGLEALQPRLGLNYQLPDRFGDTTLSASVGVFSGGDPTVWFSNAFQNFGGALGVGQATSDCDSAELNVLSSGTFQGIPECVVAGGQAQAVNNAAAVNATDPDLDAPTVNRYSFGIEHNTASGKGFFNDWNLKLDVIYSDLVDTIDFVNLSVTQTGTAPDGRPTYTRVDPTLPGCTATFNGIRNGFSGVTPLCFGGVDDILMTNSTGDDGYTFTASIQGGKSFDWGENWNLNLRGGYSYNESEIGNPGTRFTAAENFRTAVTTDLFDNSVGPSLRNTPHNFVLSGTFSNEFFDGYRTSLTAFIQIRQGAELSAVFDSGLSRSIGDPGNIARNLLYIPNGPTDPLVNFASGFDTGAFFAFVDANGFRRGTIAGKGGLGEDWSRDLDIRIQQELPGIVGDARIKLFVDFENVLNLINDDWGPKRYMNTSGIDEAVKIVDATISGRQYNYVNFTPPTEFFDTFDSLFRIQLGIRGEF